MMLWTLTRRNVLYPDLLKSGSIAPVLTEEIAPYMSRYSGSGTILIKIKSFKLIHHGD